MVSSKESLGLQLYSMLTLSGYTIPDMIELVAYDMAEFSEQVNSIISTIEVPKEQMAEDVYKRQRWYPPGRRRLAGAGQSIV